MKKVYCLVLVLMLCLTMGNVAFAGIEDGSFDITYKKTPIKDLDKLIERAKNGVSDLDLDKLNIKKGSLKNMKTGNTQELPTYVTSQHVETKKYNNGKTVKRYAITAITIAKGNHFKNKSDKVSLINDKTLLASYDSSPAFILAWDDGHTSKGYDDTYSVASVTTYWYDIVDGSFWDLDIVEGYWEIDQSGISISDKYYRWGQSGTNQSMVPVQYSDSDTVSDYDFSFYKNVDSSWDPVLIDNNFNYSIGVTTFATVHHVDGSEWSMTHPNVKTNYSG